MTWAFCVIVVVFAIFGFQAGSRPADFDAQIAEAFRIINQGRAAIGKPAFAWSPKLAASAQELADWGWAAYLCGSADITSDPHHDFVGRLERNGVVKPGESWVDKASECGLSGTSFNRGEDGKTYPRDRSGWCYPYRTPVNFARDDVYELGTGPFAKQNPTEKHVADFNGIWTHIGIGWAGGMFVIDYGVAP